MTILQQTCMNFVCVQMIVTVLAANQQLRNNQISHSVKSIRIRSYSGLHFLAFGPNAGKCGHLLRSVCSWYCTLMIHSLITVPSLFLDTLPIDLARIVSSQQHYAEKQQGPCTQLDTLPTKKSDISRVKSRFNFLNEVSPVGEN